MDTRTVARHEALRMNLDGSGTVSSPRLLAGKICLGLAGVSAMFSVATYAFDAYLTAQPTEEEQEINQLQEDCEHFLETGGLTDLQIVDLRDNVSQGYAIEAIRHEAYLEETCPTLPN